MGHLQCIYRTIESGCGALRHVVVWSSTPQTTHTHTPEFRSVVGRGVEEEGTGGGGQKVQTSGYKTNACSLN